MNAFRFGFSMGMLKAAQAKEAGETRPFGHEYDRFMQRPPPVLKAKGMSMPDPNANVEDEDENKLPGLLLPNKGPSISDAITVQKAG